MSEHSLEYDAYLASDLWRARRRRWIALTDNYCVYCHARVPSAFLQIYHVTYKRLGNEQDTDVDVCCVLCHPKADEFREIGRRIGFGKRSVLDLSEDEHDEIFDALARLYGLGPREGQAA